MVTAASKIEIRSVDKESTWSRAMPELFVNDCDAGVCYPRSQVLGSENSDIAFGNLCDGSGVIVLVNPDAQFSTRNEDLVEEIQPLSDSLSTRTPARNAECELQSDDHHQPRQSCEREEASGTDSVKALDWFRSTFSQVERGGCIPLKDFKHTAKAYEVSSE